MIINSDHYNTHMRPQKLIQRIGNATRVYTLELYKGQYCKKLTLDSQTISLLLTEQQNRGNQQIVEKMGVRSIFRLQTELNSQYIIKNINYIYSQKQLRIYQEDFDCFLSQLNLESLTFQKRFKIFQCIALGVKDLSDRNICHRFLSPDHISIISLGKNNFIAKINNFDYSEQLQSKKTLTCSSVEINQYSSPQIRYNKYHGLSTDVWSLGAILNYLLYGTINNIWEDDGIIKVQVLKNTPDWLLQFLRSMLHYNPLKRSSIQSVIQIVHSSLKCLSSLTKYIPISSGKVKFLKIQSKLKVEENE